MNPRTDRRGTGGSGGSNGTPFAEPSLGQRLAEELIADLVRRNVDVVGLLELERDVLSAMGAARKGEDGLPTPQAVLAALLVEQAFLRVAAEWRESRELAADQACPCCAFEQVEARRKRPAPDGEAGADVPADDKDGPS